MLPKKFTLVVLGQVVPRTVKAGVWTMGAASELCRGEQEVCNGAIERARLREKALLGLSILLE